MSLLNKKVVVITLAVSTAIAGGFFYYQNQSALTAQQTAFALETQREEENFEFVKSLIYTLIQVKKSRAVMLGEDQSVDQHSQWLEGAYSMREHLENAGREIIKWHNNTTPVIKAIYAEMDEALSDMLDAADAYIRMGQSYANGFNASKEDRSILKVKLDSGRNRIVTAPLVEGGIDALNLSPEHKASALEYLNNNFTDEEFAETSYYADDGELVVTHEFIAAGLIKMALE